MKLESGEGKRPGYLVAELKTPYLRESDAPQTAAKEIEVIEGSVGRVNLSGYVEA